VSAWSLGPLGKQRLSPPPTTLRSESSRRWQAATAGNSPHRTVPCHTTISQSRDLTRTTSAKEIQLGVQTQPPNSSARLPNFAGPPAPVKPQHNSRRRSQLPGKCELASVGCGLHAPLLLLRAVAGNRATLDCRWPLVGRHWPPAGRDLFSHGNPQSTFASGDTKVAPGSLPRHWCANSGPAPDATSGFGQQAGGWLQLWGRLLPCGRLVGRNAGWLAGGWLTETLAGLQAASMDNL